MVQVERQVTSQVPAQLMAASGQNPHVRQRPGRPETGEPLLNLPGSDHPASLPQLPVAPAHLGEVCVVERHFQRKPASSRSINQIGKQNQL